MRIFLSLFILLVAISAVPAQQHDEWRVFRSDEDGFSVEFPGTPKTDSRDLGGGASQKFFTVEAGSETFLVSVIRLPPGRVPASPDEEYFDVLLKAYNEGSKTNLRSRRMTTWAGQTAMEAIADAEGGIHLIDLTTSGDRVYLGVYAGAKGQENGPRATHLRDSFKLLGK
ncbi:MAG TPA: hypothetical protein VE961_13650 [Pyrinomonadaceae bacterium]|nr:hypothetical protein [Pyrinomonadaceae bacterium]